MYWILGFLLDFYVSETFNFMVIFRKLLSDNMNMKADEINSNFEKTKMSNFRIFIFQYKIFRGKGIYKVEREIYNSSPYRLYKLYIWNLSHTRFVDFHPIRGRIFGWWKINKLEDAYILFIFKPVKIYLWMWQKISTRASGTRVRVEYFAPPKMGRLRSAPKL